MITSNEIIKLLQLEKHCEGGYFFQTYESSEKVITSQQKERRQMTSIYYLLTKNSPISYFAQNKSDLVVYYHLGSPVKIIFLEQSGELTEKTLGPDLKAGQELQIVCPANTCKAYELLSGEYTLIGEAVAPGFDYEDMVMPSYTQLKSEFPNHIEQLRPYLFDANK